MNKIKVTSMEEAIKLQKSLGGLILLQSEKQSKIEQVSKELHENIDELLSYKDMKMNHGDN